MQAGPRERGSIRGQRDWFERFRILALRRLIQRQGCANTDHSPMALDRFSLAVWRTGAIDLVRRRRLRQIEPSRHPAIGVGPIAFDR
jgi:hypothetical protein